MPAYDKRFGSVGVYARRKFCDLTVRAPIGGQLTSLDAEIGQSKNKGERIGHPFVSDVRIPIIMRCWRDWK